MKTSPALYLWGIACLAPFTLTAQFDLGGLADQASKMASEKAAEYDIPPELTEKAMELAKSFGFSKANLSSYAREAVEALNGGEDLQALKLLDKVGAASLSEGQKAAFTDFKVLVDTYILKHQFSDAEKASGPLGKSLEAISSGDYLSAAGQLQGLLSTLKPTGEQKAMLSALQSQYAAWAEDSSDE